MGKVEILETINMYGYNWDNKNATALSNLFAENGVWGWYRLDGTKVMEYADKAAYKAFLEQMFSTQEGMQTRHFQTNTIFVELTETTAKTKTMYMATGVMKTGKLDMENLPILAYTGTYEDEFVKENGQWKIKIRILTTDN
jgi:prophage tail gpP-like protein